METPFACDMTAIPPEERGGHIAAIRDVFGAVEEVRELPDGYSFRLANDGVGACVLLDGKAARDIPAHAVLAVECKVLEIIGG